MAGEWGGGTFGGGPAGESVEGGKFVAQLEDDTFGGFFAEAFEFGQGGDVACGDGIAHGAGAGASEDGEGGFGSNARDVVKKETKKIALPGGEETVKDVGIFPNDEVGEQSNLFVEWGKTVVGGDGDKEFVADALAVEDGAGGPSFGESAFKKRDHLKRLPEEGGRRKQRGEGG